MSYFPLFNTKLQNFNIRYAKHQDKVALVELIHSNGYFHQHLDWRSPLEWLDLIPFLVSVYEGKVKAALACPEHPPGVAWLRLFVVADRQLLPDLWEQLWQEAMNILISRQVHSVVTLILDDWFSEIIEQSGFREYNRVIGLRSQNVKNNKFNVIEGYQLRRITREDLVRVAEVDRVSFEPIWQNTIDDLEIAFRQTSSATVVEHDNDLVGYQLSTPTQFGSHLARLAVVLSEQRKGIGKWLVADLLDSCKRDGTKSITVNTQKDNFGSITLYHNLGFEITGEVIPVYKLEI